METKTADELFQNEQAKQFPSCTQLTLCHGICNSKCIACPVGQYNFGDAQEVTNSLFADSKKTFMSMAVFQRVANEVAQYPQAWLRLHGRGEPLLHPQIVAMIDYAKNAGIKTVQCFTNAIALNEEKAQQILESKLDVLECSVHGHVLTYEKLMRNNKFEQVKNNIINFYKLRTELKAQTKIVVSAVDQPDFQSEKDQHRNFWRQYADEVIYRPYHSWGNQIAAACANLPPRRQPCPQLWTRCTISPSGKILGCFNSWEEKSVEVLGDLVADPQLTIAAVWQSRYFQLIRNNHVKGEYSLPCCETCKDWVGSSWGGKNYETLLKKIQCANEE